MYDLLSLVHFSYIPQNIEMGAFRTARGFGLIKLSDFNLTWVDLFFHAIFFEMIFDDYQLLHNILLTFTPALTET